MAYVVAINSIDAEIIPAIAKTYILYTIYNAHVMLFTILADFMLDLANVIVYSILPIQGSKDIGPL